ncbi:hypothetical protein [Mucilaginibacter flavidus]|uniref:hypothetical protein n=1 Tax=Mucilaginibacter flavidus TaxID=2949309 RepID=UPI002093992B|nr:hypothetical protein [Mucilaginibacter flavidus]MCO5951041.1 hypothetical protein [Mucilaginibacter flavidus]
MKKIFIITSLLLAACVTRKVLTSHQGQSDSYLVYKIDSIKSLYIIYAKKNGVRYKILSQKEYPKYGDDIKLNNYYNFIMQTLFTQKEDLVQGMYFHDVAIAIERDSIMSLHEAINVRGLKLIDNKPNKK